MVTIFALSTLLFSGAGLIRFVYEYRMDPMQSFRLKFAELRCEKTLNYHGRSSKPDQLASHCCLAEILPEF